MSSHVNVKFKKIEVHRSESYGIDGEPGDSAEWRMVFQVTDHESRPIQQHVWNKDGVRDDKTYSLNLDTVLPLPPKGFGVKVAGFEKDDFFGDDDIKDIFRWHTPEPGWKSGQTYKLGSNLLVGMDYTVEYSIQYMEPGKRAIVPEWAHVATVSRSTDKLDLFVTDVDGKIRTASWEPSFADGWRGWREINGGRASAGAPLHAVSRSKDKLDVFVIADQAVFTAAWEPASANGWNGWGIINDGRAPGGRVTAVARSNDKLDVFVAGADGRVMTASWEPAFTDGWRGWREIGDVKVPHGAYIHAVSRSTDKLDLFVSDVKGKIRTASWEPSFTDGWRGWRTINGGQAAPGAPVTAVCRGKDKLDIFVVGTDGGVWTASWEPSFTDGWRGWGPIGDIRVPAGSTVNAVSRSLDKLDLFVADVNGVVRTASWEPSFADGWRGWREINGGRAMPGAPSTIEGQSHRSRPLTLL
jgi:hypothetical protein